MRRRVLGILTAVAVVGGFLTILPNLVAEEEPSASAAVERTIAPGLNLARRPGVVATQWPETTDVWAKPAALAIDGNTNGSHPAGSVSHTAVATPNGPHNPYLDIDLGASFPIDRIIVWNRTDAVPERLKDFSIIVSDKPIGGPVINGNLMVGGMWHTDIIGQVPSPSLSVPVKATGRYVRVHQRRNIYLQLAEVQVIAAGLPAVGLPAEPLPSGLSNRSERLASGVADVATTGEQFLAAELAEVWALAHVGPTMFVGGRFLNVVDNATGRKTPQNYLAAFDATTGGFKAEWRPRLSGAVSELRALPDGRLLVLGAFRNVNGLATNSGAVILDPTTGAVDPSFRVRVSGGSGTVIDGDVQGDWVYLGGGFTSVAGGSSSGTTVNGYTNLARVRLSDGTPDPLWKPRITSARDPASITRGNLVTGLDASERGDRVYVSGFFGSIDNNIGAGYHAWLDTTAGRVLPGLPPDVPSTPEAQQWDVLEVGNRVLKVGTQHELFSIGRAAKQVDGVHVARPLLGARSGGGDMQHASLNDGWVYAGCHCLGSNLFWNTTNKRVGELYSTPPATEPDTPRQQLNGVWRVDPTTFKPDIKFTPQVWYSSGVRGSGQGGWAVASDADRCVWIGGDVREVRLRTGERVGQGGFTKLCPVDDVVPAAPGAFTAAWDGDTSARLSWQPVEDDRPGRGYEILRNGVIIASTTSGQFVDTAAEPNDLYAVRVVDRRGNRSATATPVNIGPRPAPVVARIAPGSAWRYITTAPPAGWTSPTFDPGVWASATTEAGWGDGDEVTPIANTPPAVFLRSTFNVPTDRGVTSAVLRYRRDDGIAISVNGVEVVRDNLPAGALSAATLASTAISGADESAWKTVQIPSSALRSGINVVTVSLHQAGARDGDASFDLDLTVRGEAATTTIAGPAIVPAGTPVRLDAATTMLGVSRLEFRLGTTVIGTDTTAPYSLAWTPPAGVSSITAVAVSESGTMASAPLTLSATCPAGQRPESAECVALPEGDVFAVAPDGTVQQHRLLADGANGGTTTIPAPRLSRVEASTGPDGRTWLTGITTSGGWIVALRPPGGAVGPWTDLGSGMKDAGIVALADMVVAVASRADGTSEARELGTDGVWTPSFDLQSRTAASVSLSRTAEATPRAVLWVAGSTGPTYQRIRTGTGSWAWWSQVKDGSTRDAASASFGGATHLVGVGAATADVCIATDRGGWSAWACQQAPGATAVAVGLADHLYYAAATPTGVNLGRRGPNGIWGAPFPFAGPAVDVAVAPSVGCPAGRVVVRGACAPEVVGSLLRIEGGRLLDASLAADATVAAPAQIAADVRRVDADRSRNGDLWVTALTTGGEWRVATRGVRSQTYSAWTTLGAGYKDVGLSVSGSGQVTVIGLNSANGAVHVRQRNADGSWAAIVDLGGTSTAVDGTHSLDRSQPRVFATAPDGTTSQRTQTGPGAWSNWERVVGAAATDVAGFSWGNNVNADGFGVGAQGAMLRMYYANGSWLGWMAPGGATPGWSSVSGALLNTPTAIYGGPGGTAIAQLPTNWTARPLTAATVTDVAIA